MSKTWLIYGANGYTGELIARRATRKGLRPILAGRNANAVGRLADELGLESRVFDLADRRAVEKNLEGCALVLHCAGPFKDTCRPVAQAAIAAKCHYLDITGEIDVYAYLHSLDHEAAAAGVMLLPGVGFDVVPTDCVASLLKKEMPDATALDLGFVGADVAAGGSIKTVVRQLPHGSMVRERGELKKIPHLSKKRSLEIDGRRLTLYSIPWGDVFTAHCSTGIPDITVYSAFPGPQIRALKLAMPFVGILKKPKVLSFVERSIERWVPAPTEAELRALSVYVWGEVRNDSGRRSRMLVRVPDTYTVTVEASLLCVERVLSGTYAKGFQTPSKVFGPDLVFEIDGVTRVPERSSGSQY